MISEEIQDLRVVCRMWRQCCLNQQDPGEAAERVPQQHFLHAVLLNSDEEHTLSRCFSILSHGPSTWLTDPSHLTHPLRRKDFLKNLEIGKSLSFLPFCFQSRRKSHNIKTSHLKVYNSVMFSISQHCATFCFHLIPKNFYCFEG